MPLSFEAKALLDMVYRVGAPRFHELSTDQARHSFRKLQFAFRADAPPVASVTDVPLTRPDGTVLLGRLYRPLDSRPDEELPLIVYFHGGGWCVGDVDSYDVLCRQLANGSRCSVLSVEYRLAPESPFPAAVEDAIFCTEWAARSHGLLGIDPGRIALTGDSAGGNLCIVTALAARESRAVSIRFIVLIYPSTEIFSSRSSRKEFGRGYLLDSESLEWFYARYLRHGDAYEWRASPMLAESFSGLPPMLLVTAECDPLRDDGVAFAERVREEGGSVEHLAVPGVVHGFLTLGKFFPEAREVLQQITARLEKVLHGSR